MSSKKHKLAVVIGRFQLFTQSHMSMIEEALDVADNVIVLVGPSTDLKVCLTRLIRRTQRNDP